jgi:hypothetical protein
MNLVEIEKPASRWQGREGRRSNRAPRVDCTRMKLYAEIGIGIQFFRKYAEAAENEGGWRNALRRSVCECKKTKGREFVFFANGTIAGMLVNAKG